MYYVKIDSWHIVSDDDSDGETLCGLHPDADAETDGELRLTDKSCESCLRIQMSRQADEARVS